MSKKLAIAIGLLWLGGCGTNEERTADAETSAVLNAHVMELQRTLSEGNRLWDAGERGKAVEQYLVVLNDPLGGQQTRWNRHEDDVVRARAMTHVAGRSVPELQSLPTAYNRTIDHLVTNGLGGTARPLIRQALTARINLALTSPEANDVLSDEMARREQENADARERLGSDKSGGRQSSVEVDTTLLVKLRPGMTESEVISTLGQPHDIRTTEMPAVPPLGKSARTLVTWTYNPGADSFIVLLFENGLLENGESGGYSIKSGLKIPSPK